MPDPPRILNPGAAFLATRCRNDFSQFGEDGLIEAIFEKIGITNRWCFEVGAADGIWISNTRRYVEAGWTAVLIESDAEQFEKLCDNTPESCFCIHHAIRPSSLDSLLSSVGGPVGLDLGVIDIDSWDYWAWEGMKVYRPRLMMVEISANKQAGLFPFTYPPNQIHQAGIQPMCALAIEKGYVPLAATGVNLLSVREDVWEAAEK